MVADLSSILVLYFELWRLYRSPHFGFDEISSVSNDISNTFIFKLWSIPYQSRTNWMPKSKNVLLRCTSRSYFDIATINTLTTLVKYIHIQVQELSDLQICT